MKSVTRQAARLLHDGALIHSEMEAAGVRVDVPYLEGQIKSVGDRIERRVKRLRDSKEYAIWRKTFGDKAKLGSKVQLATVVFDVMGFKRKKVVAKKVKTEEGGKRESQYSEEAFSEVDLPFVRNYFKTEKLKKLKSTYLEGLHSEVVDGFVHPSYNLHTVVSYRSSCNQNNFQNILARNKELSDLIRRCYIPRKGRQLVEIDFGQIEVRVAACYNRDPKLIRYIKDSSTDMHRDMAAKLFSMTTEFLVKESQWAKKSVRDWAKNRFVFPEFYGSVYFQCAPALWKAVVSGVKMPDGVTTIQDYLKGKGVASLGDCEAGADVREGTFVSQVKKAEDYLWNETFTVYTAWKKKWYDAYLKEGGFDLLTGFRIDGLYNRNDVLNYGIQGSSFHCLLWSLIQIGKYIRSNRMKSRLIGQIHDCSIADVHPSELQDYLGEVREIKTKRLLEHYKWLIVPMEIEAETCDVDQPWNTKRVWVENKGVWSPKS